MVGEDSRGGDANGEGEHSGGVGGEACDRVKGSGADGGDRGALKIAEYICGRRQGMGHLARGTGDGKGEQGHKASGAQVGFQWDIGSRSWEQMVLEEPRQQSKRANESDMCLARKRAREGPG